MGGHLVPIIASRNLDTACVPGIFGLYRGTASQRRSRGFDARCGVALGPMRRWEHRVGSHRNTLLVLHSIDERNAACTYIYAIISAVKCIMKGSTTMSSNEIAF